MEDGKNLGKPKESGRHSTLQSKQHAKASKAGLRLASAVWGMVAGVVYACLEGGRRAQPVYRTIRPHRRV